MVKDFVNKIVFEIIMHAPDRIHFTMDAQTYGHPTRRIKISTYYNLQINIVIDQYKSYNKPRHNARLFDSIIKLWKNHWWQGFAFGHLELNIQTLKCTTTPENRSEQTIQRSVLHLTSSVQSVFFKTRSNFNIKVTSLGTKKRSLHHESIS
jgi:hypothetical protein